MSASPSAEIIAIGTEILLGEITDTNSVYIARVLRDIGMNLFYMTSVGDNENRIAAVIRTALTRSNVVITCGGLGPTVDDMTRQAVAAATERQLVFHQELLDRIAERFASFRVQMTDNNRRQAFLPEGALVIENPVGTAPAFIVDYQDRVVISLPGVPREMKFLMTERVIPFLRERYQLGGIIKTRVLRTAGIGESSLDAQIGEDLLRQSNPTVGLSAHTGQVDVRITAKASSHSEADQMIAVTEEQLRRRIGDFIYGVDGQTIEDALVKLLETHQATLAVTQTGVGAAVSAPLEATAAGKGVLKVVETYNYPEEVRQAMGLEDNLGLRDMAERAAEHLQRRAETTAAIAVISLPTAGDRADTDGSTAIAAYVGGQVRSRMYGFGGQADVAPVWASTWAMSMLWRMLKEQFTGV